MMKLCFHVPATHLETVEECRVEMVCDDHCIVAVLAALRAAHPYEEPAFDVVRVESF